MLTGRLKNNMTIDSFEDGINGNLIMDDLYFVWKKDGILFVYHVRLNNNNSVVPCLI